MAVKLSALRARSPLPPRKFLVLISIRGWVNFSATVRLEGLGQLKNPVTSLEIEPAPFQVVAWFFNQLRKVNREGGEIVLPQTDSNTK
jgi:hypothetical protein